MERSSSAGEVDAQVTRIVRQDAAFVARVLRRYGVRSGDIDDARQDVFMVVHRRLPEFEARAALRTWLYRICVCVAADYRKRAHRRRERGGDTLEPRSEPCADRLAISAQLARGLEQALERIDPRKRAVFVLYEFEELTITEIAAQLGCPPKTAFSRLYAARRELHADLRRAGYAALPACLLWLPPWKANALAAAPQLVAAGKLGATACVAAFALVSVHTLPVREPYAIVSLGAGEDDAALPVPIAPADPLRVEAPPPAPVPTPVSRPPRVRRPRAQYASARPVDPPPAAASDWIQAPTPKVLPPAAAAAPPPAVGLDEVLSATSIRPLLRVGPAKSQRGSFLLVPPR